MMVLIKKDDDGGGSCLDVYGGGGLLCPYSRTPEAWPGMELGIKY